MRLFKRQPVRSPVNAYFSKYQQSITQGVQISGRKSGYIPHPLDLSHLTGKKIFIGYRGEALPSVYDLRPKGRVSPVKDQGLAGTCWIFATYGSLESCLLPEEKWDFSENNMKNLLAEECPQGYDRPFDGGGNQWMSTAYLSRWSGPVLEKNDPYDPFQGNCDVFPARKHIRRVVFIPPRKSPTDNTNLKTAIMNSGAVFTAMAYDDGYYNEETTSYYSSEGFPNHVVNLVGWDDNYSRKKFKTRPPGDGAFIVKNSWGQNWGDKGYFNISYYDFFLGMENALFSRTENPKSAQIIHQYDPLGWIASYGFQSDTAWFSNIFEAETNQNITGFGFYTASPYSSYNIYVYENVTAGKPRSGRLTKSFKGTIDEPSYYVRNFSSPVRVKQGKKFSLVVELTTPAYDYPIPCEVRLEGISSKAKSSPGQGYISDNGKTWDDIYALAEDASICLKAFAELK